MVSISWINPTLVMRVLSSGKVEINKIISFKLPMRIVTSEQKQTLKHMFEMIFVWELFCNVSFSSVM